MSSTDNLHVATSGRLGIDNLTFHHPLVAKLWGPIVGPLVAVISFVCQCFRCIEIQRADAVRLYGPHAVLKDLNGDLVLFYRKRHWLQKPAGVNRRA